MLAATRTGALRPSAALWRMAHTSRAMATAIGTDRNTTVCAVGAAFLHEGEAHTEARTNPTLCRPEPQAGRERRRGHRPPRRCGHARQLADPWDDDRRHQGRPAARRGGSKMLAMSAQLTGWMHAHGGGRGVYTQALDTIQGNDQIKSVVLISAKQDGFIAGADINMLAAAKDEKELEEVRAQGEGEGEGARLGCAGAAQGCCGCTTACRTPPSNAQTFCSCPQLSFFYPRSLFPPVVPIRRSRLILISLLSVVCLEHALALRALRSPSLTNSFNLH